MKYILDERFILNENFDLNDLPAESGIYCIIFNALDAEGNPCEKKYVGQAVNIKRRLSDHKKAARADGRDYLVYNAMRKYPDFRVVVLTLCPKQELDQQEIHWIRTLHTYVNDKVETGKTVAVPEDNPSESLLCDGPGYNLTTGGRGAPYYYTDDIIAEIVDLYKQNNYDHVQTLQDFKKVHEADIHLNRLASDTLRLIIEANKLPWYNQTKKVTVVCSNTIQVVETKEKNAASTSGYRTRRNFKIIPNTQDKYLKICESQAQADALVDFIFNRIMSDLGEELLAIQDNKVANAKRIQYLIDNNYYEKYLDLTQYDLAKLPKTSKSLGKGVKNQTGRKVTTGRLSLFTIYYSISTKSIK